MDRNEGIIRWSPNQSRDEFTTFNLNNKVCYLFRATGHAQPGRFDYKRISKHTELPAVNTYDWSPTIGGLVAVGTAHGEVSLLRIDDNSNACLTLPLKLQRPCQSVSFNTTGLLAVGLDRVRNDSCLQVWDVNQRLGDWDSHQKGWNVQSMNIEPKKKLEGSTSITSIRFYEDQPQTLIAGVKNQSVRIHDLRDPSSTVINFQTRCNNNLAIDYTDPNYFASSSLDQPGLVVWDRRVSGRSTVSPMYLESFDQEEMPWGAVLKLDRAIQVDKNTFVKQLRFSREQRGALGVLSTAGQLQILQTKKEYVEPGSANDVRDSPELLEIKKSYDLEYPFFEHNHRRKYEHRIVSFDWLNLGTSELQGRVIALRANGEFEILQMPSSTASQLSQLIPWTPPHHAGDSYLNLMQFADPIEQEKVLGPLYATAAKAATPVFGPDKFTKRVTINSLSYEVQKSLSSTDDPVVDLLAPSDSGMGVSASTTSEAESLGDDFTQLQVEPKESKHLPSAANRMPDSGTHKPLSSSRELNDQAHYSALSRIPISKSSREQLDHVMLLRVIDGYLFDPILNQKAVADDNWLQDVWKWIAGAEEAAHDDAMVSLPLDLSYLGVHTVWMNKLGEKSKSRLVDSTVIPDGVQWERLIAVINKRAGRPSFEGVQTARPHHRQLCLAICGLLRSPDELEEDLVTFEQSGKHTTAAAMALFEGIPKRAVEILKRGGTDLLFVAMALDIKLKSPTALDLDGSEWSKALESHPRMGEDPYLRAIYGYITTGDWTAIADSTSLPLRDRVWVALKNFPDQKLSEWLTKEMEEATRTGDIEGIVLAGITDNMVDILAKYVEKFMDYQTPILIMSFCYPRYIDDIRCDAWRRAYMDFLQRHKQHISRVRFHQQSTIKSRSRDGRPVIKPAPRQITIRCLNCETSTANDLGNTGILADPTRPVSSSKMDKRNPLTSSGINGGLCCPRCGSHLPRCAICMEFVGMPRSDRPEISTDHSIKRMANFPTFCLKCKHVQHMAHAIAWFKRHNECPVPECQCPCNEVKCGQRG
ncbi:WD repeat domain-containing protein [Drepanopeziza brunnea f. sp. 'multigermtubi' MB_m1]|uniref:WD repeat domain-containing protein n=1 Tax=Marssonina brunnea f. sp. multigermtubi (strain MB_m1) TaxID=1072389 RepID=K1Y220_MARBU|nr:WD repeat domain-containing protein [Drepanopeziza brunnea f. sp. 'multigermtubi' MB_m1]EKD19149.1 WD repeat domain-containing protein [Drepanopeziza brunnea f. sp. 'multigermtubi' MB_m1]